ncbi:hypothetical protein OAK16_04510 [Verrucomicrobia bacterium]|nr:hypothetical protein [Verrucomicrobiota bacterium]
MKYKLGRIEGLQNLFFKNGVKAIEFTIINDKRHGELIWYNEDGSLYGKRSYHMSFRHGEEIYYNQDGSVSKKNTWDMGRKLFEVEVVHKNERGVDERDDAFERMSDGRFFFNGTPYTGKGYNLFDNGNKAAEFFFNEGIMVGKFTSWHENGKQKSESFYIGGRIDINAPSKIWNSKGEPVDSFEEAEK